MGKSITALAACLALSVAVVAGCGGGGEEESTTAAGGEGAAKNDAAGREAAGGGESSATQPSAPTSKPLSKSEFITKANALCEKQKRQMQATVSRAFKSMRKGGSQGAVAQQAAIRRIVEEGIAPAMEAEAAGLTALGAPQGDEGKVEAIVAAIEAIVAEAREDPRGFVGDPSVFDRVKKLAAAYGVGACGSPS